MDQAQISSFWESVVPHWVLSEALFLTAKLRIADVIGGDTTELDVIAQKTGTNRDSLRRLLNVLVAHGIFTKVMGRSIWSDPPLDSVEIRCGGFPARLHCTWPAAYP